MRPTIHTEDARSADIIVRQTIHIEGARILAVWYQRYNTEVDREIHAR